MNEVVLLNAEAGSSPSGTGSFDYFSNFTVIVKLAFNKQVNIFGHDLDTSGWHPFPCGFANSLPGNVETCTVHVKTRIPNRPVRRRTQVSGNTFWDNNFGNNYILDTQAAEGTDGVGTAV